MVTVRANQAAAAGRSRRRLYREAKRLLAPLIAPLWPGPRGGLKPALRRFLRARSRTYFARLAGDRAFALAAVAALVATASAAALPAISLSAVSKGNGGFVINGIDPSDDSGFSVAGAGDVNGDGLADVIVGAPFADPGGKGIAGESYVVFGRAGGTAVNLADVSAGDSGFVISGVDPGDLSGFSVSGAGDVNGDGLADVIVGAYHAGAGNGQEGESYVVFGKADGKAIDLADVAAGAGGFAILGADADDRSGFSVAGAGDVNGDGLEDVIIGAWGADPGGNLAAGESYVVFGKADGAPVLLADVSAGTGGFVMNGIDPSDDSGWSVSGAGDVNGDGLADVIVGAWRANASAGESYVVFGKADGAAVNLSDVVTGDGGFVLTGIDPYDYSGWSVSGAGDVNGDGLADVIVGARRADGQSGESYVVFGKADGTAVDLATVVGGAGGFVIDGIDPQDFAGETVAGAGDVNGDGLSDVIVGAGADPAGNSNAGESYVVFGKTGGAAVALAAVAAGSGGFAINGIDPLDKSGQSVAGAGDVNGDGLSDLIIGAWRADPPGGDSAGESYVVFSPVVPGDLDGNGSVGIVDLLVLLAAWGPCADACPPHCPGDLDGDCAVGITDLLVLLANWS